MFFVLAGFDGLIASKGSVVMVGWPLSPWLNVNSQRVSHALGQFRYPSRIPLFMPEHETSEWHPASPQLCAKPKSETELYKGRAWL